jgi:hypothetical protein
MRRWRLNSAVPQGGEAEALQPRDVELQHDWFGKVDAAISTAVST